ELLGGTAGGPLVEVGDHHHGALGGEPGGDAPADAAGGAGDEADAAGEVLGVGGGGRGLGHDGSPRIGWGGHGASSRSTVWRAVTSFMIRADPTPICRPSPSRCRSSVARSAGEPYWPWLSRHWWITSIAVLCARHLHIVASLVCGSPQSFSQRVLWHSRRAADSSVSASASGKATPWKVLSGWSKAVRVPVYSQVSSRVTCAAPITCRPISAREKSKPCITWVNPV